MILTVFVSFLVSWKMELINSFWQICKHLHHNLQPGFFLSEVLDDTISSKSQTLNLALFSGFKFPRNSIRLPWTCCIVSHPKSSSTWGICPQGVAVIKMPAVCLRSRLSRTFLVLQVLSISSCSNLSWSISNSDSPSRSFRTSLSHLLVFHSRCWNISVPLPFFTVFFTVGVERGVLRFVFTK